MKTLALLFILFSVAMLVTSDVQAQPYYYRSGDPTQTANWGNIPDGTGTPPSNFSQSTEYIIGSGKTADVFSAWTFSGNATLRVVDGGTLKNNSSVLINGTCSFCLNDGATYIHNTTINAASNIFGGTEAFGANSNFIITNWSGASDPLWTGINNTLTGFCFGNLELNWTKGSGEWNQKLLVDSIKWCAGDFKITNIGVSSLVMQQYSPNVRYVELVILGNFIQNGGDFLPAAYNNQCELRICKNFYKTGGRFYGIDNGYTLIYFNGSRIGNTEPQTIYCNDSLIHTHIGTPFGPGTERIKLISDLKLYFFDNPGLTLSCLFRSTKVYLDFGVYKLSTNQKIFNHSVVVLQLGHPYGLDSNLSCFNMVEYTNENYFEYEYNGSQPQMTGNNLGILDTANVKKITINNPTGVTLSRNLIVKDSIEFKAGVLNLGNFNLRFDAAYDGNDPNAYKGVSATSYINTNGTGLLKQYRYMNFPAGNGSLTPAYLTTTGLDTVSLRVINDFPYAAVYDTSRMIKKCWYIDAPLSNDIGMILQWSNNSPDAGRKFNSDSIYGGINKFLTYDPLFYLGPPSGLPPLYNVPNAAIILQSYHNYENAGDLHGRYFILGNEDGILQQYFYNNGEASDPNSWIDPLAPGGLVSPPDLSRTAIYTIGQNKTAVFNSPVTMANTTVTLRATGNGIIQSNAPVTCFGKFQLLDSSTYNHSNNAQLKTTLFAGKERINEFSNFNILMWSDTTDKISDGLNNELYTDKKYFGNLTIDFNNIPGPLGLATWGPQLPIVPSFYSTSLTMGTFHLKNCSGYMFAPGVGGYESPDIYVGKDLIIGDSLSAYNPMMNLSYQTLKSSDSAATTLHIGRDLLIYTGGITSEQPYNKARGRLIFTGTIFSDVHHFYQSPEFFYRTSNLGCEKFPNLLEWHGTLILRSNFYNSTNTAFIIPDIFEVNGTLDCGDYIMKSIDVRVKDEGKVLIRKPDGLNWVFNVAQSLHVEGNGKIEYCGNVPQLTGSSLPDNLTGLNINNPAGVTLTKPTTVTDTINFYAGKFFTDSANCITLLNTTRIYNQDSSTGIVGSAAVKCVSAGGFFLPIGSRGAIDEVDCFLQNGDETTFQLDFHNGNPYSQNCIAPLTNVHNNLWFRITRTSAGIPRNASFAFYWSRPLGISNVNNLRAAKYDGTQWVACGTQGNSGSNESGFVTTDVISSFSPFTIGSIDDQPLPVELSSFTSQVSGNKMNLNWITSAEQNNSGFEIQRAKVGEDSVPFKKIGYVNGHGNSNTTNTYSFEDRNLVSGKYKYRLRQFDFNGNYKYYELANEVTIGVPSKYNMSQNYPNPFNPTTKINYELPFDSKVSIRLFDMTGREVANVVNGIQTAGYYTVQFNASFLSSGTYFYNIIAEGGNTKFTTTKKMVLVK